MTDQTASQLNDHNPQSHKMVDRGRINLRLPPASLWALVLAACGGGGGGGTTPSTSGTDSGLVERSVIGSRIEGARIYIDKNSDGNFSDDEYVATSDKQGIFRIAKSLQQYAMQARLENAIRHKDDGSQESLAGAQPMTALGNSEVISAFTTLDYRLSRESGPVVDQEGDATQLGILQNLMNRLTKNFAAWKNYNPNKSNLDATAKASFTRILNELFDTLVKPPAGTDKTQQSGQSQQVALSKAIANANETIADTNKAPSAFSFSGGLNGLGAIEPETADNGKTAAAKRLATIVVEDDGLGLARPVLKFPETRNIVEIRKGAEAGRWELWLKANISLDFEAGSPDQSNTQLRTINIRIDLQYDGKKPVAPGKALEPLYYELQILNDTSDDLPPPGPSTNPQPVSQIDADLKIFGLPFQKANFALNQEIPFLDVDVSSFANANIDFSTVAYQWRHTTHGNIWTSKRLSLFDVVDYLEDGQNVHGTYEVTVTGLFKDGSTFTKTGTIDVSTEQYVSRLPSSASLATANVTEEDHDFGESPEPLNIIVSRHLYSHLDVTASPHNDHIDLSRLDSFRGKGASAIRIEVDGGRGNDWFFTTLELGWKLKLTGGAGHDRFVIDLQNEWDDVEELPPGGRVVIEDFTRGDDKISFGDTALGHIVYWTRTATRNDIEYTDTRIGTAVQDQNGIYYLQELAKLNDFNSNLTANDFLLPDGSTVMGILNETDFEAQTGIDIV